VVPASPGVGAEREKHLHVAGQVGLWRLEEDMEMVGRDDASIELPGAARYGAPEVVMKPRAIVAVARNVRASAAVGHDVVDRALVVGT
jgi:hypothetical protein